jgi:hypothetical protein
VSRRPPASILATVLAAFLWLCALVFCGAAILQLTACGTGEPPGAPDAAVVFDAAPPEGQGASPRGDVAINEVAASPPIGQDWIELVNRGAGAVDISGWFITDAVDRPDHFYVFPAGTTIQPSQYLIVWADDALGDDGFNAPFELGRAEAVHLLTADGHTADSLLYLDDDSGRSLQRVPDREGLFFQAAPTPAAANPAEVGP